ncbi:ubiquitin-associated domain-containing protein 1-like isoform X2 [Hemicordylus capensis]|uniref:ubiquitin-associated domain-containing protein 1-like isoform X2 n=1 Tax=Hemicordylus capensis TaxID=884348 RepID=UPI0023031800|nr:ubiquitin-associated domain-containing protein 1-like isoform X2 [Hemicordylus capensis]
MLSPTPAWGLASGIYAGTLSCSMSVTQAMEWLTEERDNRTMDAPLPGQLLLGNSAEAGTSSSTTTTKAVAGASLEASREEPKDELMEIFKKIHRKREFRPDPQAVIALVEMGFDEREVVDALQGNNHQQNTVCEWLLGDRKPTPEDVDQGIDPSSPLFQAILENPVVQLRLTNPKTLLGKCCSSVGKAFRVTWHRCISAASFPALLDTEWGFALHRRM